MTDRTFRPALLLVAAAFSGCGACDGGRETRRIDLGLPQSPQTPPSEPSEDAPPAAPAGEAIADSGEGEGGEPAEAPGEPAAGAEPDGIPAATGTAATGVGASPPQQP